MASKKLEESSHRSSNLPKRDHGYYLDAEPVIFQVEHSLFKVPRYQFMRYSDVFRTVFSLPRAGGDPEGSSDEVPFKLEGVSSVDFQRLLAVLYPLPVEIKPMKSEDEWISVLKLSTMWNMSPIRELAIVQLSTTPIDPVVRIVLGKTHSVPLWLRLGYLQVVLRQSPLSFEEGQKVGWQTAIRLCHLREDAASNPTRWVQTGYNNIIEDEFGDELREVTMAYECHDSTPRLNSKRLTKHTT